MAGEKIFSNHFQNITLVDPNKIINANGFPEDRNVKQEDLVMYANLECSLQPRSRLVVGENGGNLERISVAKINFLKPNGQDYLTTNWSDFFTGRNGSETLNSELLGITNITYRCNSSFMPTVDIILEDVRGRALFESGNDSVYSAFFNLPYPTFYLTLKGYYGKAVQYQLILQKFQASFDQSSGNFIINMNFLGYKYNVLSDIAQAYLIALPSMYVRESVTNLSVQSATPSQASASQINGNDQQTNAETIFGGYEKIKEVYKIYKEKGLIGKDVPELTIQELINRLENFEKTIMSNFKSTSIDELTNAKNFRKILSDFKKAILTVNKEAIKLKNLNIKETYYVIDEFDKLPYEVFTYKSDITDYKAVVSEFESTIEVYNKKLEEAPTFGEKAAKNNEYKIPSSISIKKILGNVFIDVLSIDVEETAKKRFKKITPSELEKSNISLALEKIKEKQKILESELQPGQSLPPFFFRFDGRGFFTTEIDKMFKMLDEKVQIIEKKLTDEINKSLLQADTGIGFNPTIRNVIGVVMASTDAFLRKLSEVHSQAFSNNNSLIKKNACPNDVKQDTDSPVFPWPQFAVQISNSSGVTQYDLKYPGDPKYINTTGAFDYSVWPEVEFVEEFVRGITLRQQPPLEPSSQANIENTIKRILISGFDTPSNNPYSNLQSQSFFYEIWERIKSIAIYQGFNRNEAFGNLLNFIQAAEATNVIVGLGDGSLDINNPLKNNNFIPSTYLDYLYQISNNGVTESWQNYMRGKISTKYLREEIKYPSEILKEDLPEISQELITETEPTKVEESINQYLKDTNKNFVDFTDTYPFVIPEWNILNLNNSNSNSSVDKVLDVSKTLFYSVKQKKILNYKSDFALDNLGDTSLNRPFTFVPNNASKIDYALVQSAMDLFYENRIQSNDFEFTEGQISKEETDNTLIFTSSILNSPFFINAIQEGVTNQKNNSSSPYISASYLFLNSLPLADVTYQYLDTTTNQKNNYIGPSFRKYGAIHALPKTWIARIGSIWYRYKTYVETGTDILSSVMGNFDISTNFDPVTSDLSKQYEFTTPSKNYKIKFQNTDNIVINSVAQTVDSYSLGFYPKLLNDFYYFLNGENLYSDNATIQDEIQEKINSGEVILLNNSDSTINKPAGYDTANPTNNLSIINLSVLFKSKVKNKTQGQFYFSAPSFGSRYNQVNSVCFSNGILTRPIDSNVFNGSVRFFWGGTHFGYFPTVNTFCEYNEIPKTHEDKQWAIYIQGTLSAYNINSSYIDYILATFTKEELDLFEAEFLNFSKNKDNCDNDFNLQTILQNSMAVENVDLTDTENIFLQKFQEKQQTKFSSYINTLLNFNFLFKKGNPTNINYKNWVEQSYTPNRFLFDSIIPDPYIPNSLPTSGNSVTLLLSETNYPDAWKALKLNVGFFEWQGFTYSDNGSYITDFFVEMGVAFTKENVEKYASLIKIYATQKYLNSPSSDYSNDFRLNLNDYLVRLENFGNEIFTGSILKIQKNISEMSVVIPEGEEDSKTTGQLTKLEYYELFKAINDKWVAGNNYNSETLFEDILFFDRANRDIGDVVVVDIFETVKYLKTNPKASVFQMVSSIIQTNNFVIFPMPAYINFYNVQEVGEIPREEDEYSFAEKLFGIFSEVDYQGSKQKLVCQYTEKPSEQTKNPSTYNGYKDDTWNFGKPDNNPLLDNLDNKSNYALSNKVVGMNVDFGLQNQGVFKTIQVSQDVGKATSESLRMEYETANLTRGTQAFTQSVSLYNIYKSRSYSATITAFGNAIIQPTMYFNLQNVPLFSGPYLITDVEHVVTPGDFTTKFTGTRQKLFTPPIENPLLSVIKNNFINKLVDRLVTKKEKDKTLSQNTIAQRDEVVNSINNTNVGPSENPQCKPISTYDSYKLITAPVKKTSTVKEIQKIIYDEIGKLNGDKNMTFIVYTLFYLKSYKNNKFEFFENNVSQVPIGNSITTKWGGNLGDYFKKEYMCLTDDTSEAYVTFESVEKCVDFNFNKYKDVFKEEVINVANKDLFVSGFTKTWIEKVPIDKTKTTADLYSTFIVTNQSEFELLKEKVEKAWSSVTTYISQI